MSSSSRKHVLKVLILGDSGVGKTSLIQRYVHNQFTGQYRASIGADFLTKEVMIDDKLVALQIWDTAGQERFQSLNIAFYRGSDCCILVYDVNTVKSFEKLDFWREEFLKQVNPRIAEDFPFAVLANKVDLDTRAVSTKDGKAWCSERGNIRYYETSAKEDLNVDEAFMDVCRAALRSETAEPEAPPTIKLHDVPGSSGDGCSC